MTQDQLSQQYADREQSELEETRHNEILAFLDTLRIQLDDIETRLQRAEDDRNAPSREVNQRTACYENRR